MSASAILYISSSVPECFRAFTANSTILQLSFVYPFVESILSMLGAYVLGPRLVPSYEKERSNLCIGIYTNLDLGCMVSSFLMRVVWLNLRVLAMGSFLVVYGGVYCLQQVELCETARGFSNIGIFCRKVTNSIGGFCAFVRTAFDSRGTHILAALRRYPMHTIRIVVRAGVVKRIA